MIKISNVVMGILLLMTIFTASGAYNTYNSYLDKDGANYVLYDSNDNVILKCPDASPLWVLGVQRGGTFVYNCSFRTNQTATASAPFTKITATGLDKIISSSVTILQTDSSTDHYLRVDEASFNCLGSNAAIKVIKTWKPENYVTFDVKNSRFLQTGRSSTAIYLYGTVGGEISGNVITDPRPSVQGVQTSGTIGIYANGGKDGGAMAALIHDNQISWINTAIKIRGDPASAVYSCGHMVDNNLITHCGTGVDAANSEALFIRDNQIDWTRGNVLRFSNLAHGIITDNWLAEGNRNTPAIKVDNTWLSQFTGNQIFFEGVALGYTSSDAIQITAAGGASNDNIIAENIYRYWKDGATTNFLGSYGQMIGNNQVTGSTARETKAIFKQSMAFPGNVIKDNILDAPT